MDRNDLLTATRGVFLRSFNATLPELVADSSDALFLAADKASSLSEQRLLLDARAALMTREHAWRQQLSAGMDGLLNRSYQTAYSTFRPSFSDAFSAQSLSLIDAGEFDGELKIDEITTRLRNAAEEQLRDLNIRMAILFDQDDISERENPFRPYLLSRCISITAEQLEIEPELYEVLCESLANELLRFVPQIYEALNQLLAQHGIAAQLQLKVRQLPDSLRQMAASGITENNADFIADPQQGITAVSAGARVGQWAKLMRQQAQYGQFDESNSVDAPGDEMPSSVGWLGGVRQMGAAIRQLFGGQAAIQLAPQAISSRLNASLQQMQGASEVQLDEQGQVRNLILEQRAELNEATQDINEQMIIDIVGMLFEFILRDGQVPAEIRAQLGRLQWLVLKTALQDPALFSHQHHPARLLVNRIGSIAQGLQQLDPKAERVTAEIRRIIETLLREEAESVDLFARMLDELDRFIARELRAADEKSASASQAIEHAESRTLRFARITAQSAQALAPFTLDKVLYDFLTQTWPYAIEFAERHDEVQALCFRMFVPELIWSIAPKADKAERQQLLGMIPRLIAVLNDGLKLTPWSNQEQQQFKTYMIDVHRAALGNVPALGVEVASLDMLRLQLSDFIGGAADEAILSATRVDFDAVNPVLLAGALNEFHAELGFIDQEHAAELADLPPASAMGELNNEALFERLRSGVPVEINLTGKLQRAQLCWMSQHETRLLLNVDDRPSVISVTAFRRLLNAGRARWLEQAPLFERAMASLLNSADVMDAKLT